MARPIDNQRCYTIYSNELDLLLVKLQMSSDPVVSFEAAYIFKSDGGGYDVVVNTYRKHGYKVEEKELHEFLTKMKPKGAGKL